MFCFRPLIPLLITQAVPAVSTSMLFSTQCSGLSPLPLICPSSYLLPSQIPLCPREGSSCGPHQMAGKLHSLSKLKCNLRALLPSSIPKWKLLLDIQLPVSGREAKGGSFISPWDPKQAHSGCATLTESFNLGSPPSYHLWRWQW